METDTIFQHIHQQSHILEQPHIQIQWARANEWQFSSAQNHQFVILHEYNFAEIVLVVR